MNGFQYSVLGAGNCLLGFGVRFMSIKHQLQTELDQLPDFMCQPRVYMFDPLDLLEFAPDGAGNGLYFYRGLLNGLIVDWDHETREVVYQRQFWELVDDCLSTWISRSLSDEEIERPDSDSIDLLDLWH